MCMTLMWKTIFFGTAFARCSVTVSLVVNNRVMVHPAALEKVLPDVFI